MSCGYGINDYGKCSCNVAFDGLFDLYFRRVLAFGGYDTNAVVGLARYPSIVPIGHTADVAYDSSQSPNRPWSISPANEDVDGLETIFAYHGGGAGGGERIWCLEKRAAGGFFTGYWMTLYDAVSRQELWTTNVDEYYRFSDSPTTSGSLGAFRSSGNNSHRAYAAPWGDYNLSIGDDGMRSVSSDGRYFEMDSAGNVVHDDGLLVGKLVAPRMFPYAVGGDESGTYFAEHTFNATTKLLEPGGKTYFGSGFFVQQFDLNPYGYGAICGTGVANQVGVWVDGGLAGTIALGSGGQVWSVHRAFTASPYVCVCYNDRVRIYSGTSLLWTSGAMDAKVICDMSSDRWFYLRGAEFTGFGFDYDPIVESSMTVGSKPWGTFSTEFYGYLVSHDASQGVAAGYWVTSGGNTKITKYNGSPAPLIPHSRCDCVHNSAAVGGNIPADAAAIDPAMD